MGKIYPQSAAVPYRNGKRDLQILLITSQSGKNWIVPKGLIEPDLTASESAAKEALEEAGIEGRMHKNPSGSYRYQKWGGTCEVEVFLMEVTKVHAAWEEDHFRSREWVSATDASEMVREKEIIRIIHELAKKI